MKAADALRQVEKGHAAHRIAWPLGVSITYSYTLGYAADSQTRERWRLRLGEMDIGPWQPTMDDLAADDWRLR